jgi:hypothetical protein
MTRIPWLIIHELDGGWRVDCVQPGCLWSINGLTPDRLDDATAEHTTTAHPDGPDWFNPDEEETS